MRNRIFQVLALFIAATATAFAQSNLKEMPLRELPLSGEPVLTELGGFATFGPIICDDSENIYARFFTGGGVDPMQAAITKIDSKGQVTRIEMPRTFGEEPQQMLLFAVSPDGDVYEVLRVAAHDADRKLAFKTLLLRFSRTATLASRMQFPFAFIPSILIPLSNEEVLVGGARIEAEDKASEGKQFLAVFSSSGQMTREFSVPGNRNESKVEGGPIDPQFGKAQLGPDGNLYVLSKSSPPLLKVISQTGKLIRKLTLKEPFGDSNAANLFISPNQLLVVFGPKPETRGKVAYVLYDSETGTPIQAYHPAFSGDSVCWNGKELQVIVADKKRTGFLVGKATLP